MKATERTFQQIIVSPDRYVIPVFQRHYSWSQGNWEKLWEDLVALSQPSEEKRSHFLGAIVCAAEEHTPGIPPSYEVIDGQQRLMTLSILLCAIRHAANKKRWDKLAAEVEENFLIHKFEKNGEHYRVYPRMRDRGSYKALVDSLEAQEDTTSTLGSQVRKAYNYFSKQLEDEGLLENEGSLQKHFEMIKTQLDFVLIILGRENPYKIFKSLNSTGVDLNQGDLIRNHVFMAIPDQEQDIFDDNHWAYLEKHFEDGGKLDGNLFASFFRDVLMSDGKYIQESEVFKSFEDIYPKGQIKPLELIGYLNEQAGYYDIIRGKKSHSVRQIHKSLQAIRDLKVTASYHLILALFHKHKNCILSDEDLVQALQAIASFVLRRHVCKESTRLHGTWFCTACGELKDQPLENLITYLKTKNWPADEIFIPAIQKMNLYASIQKQAILHGLELALQVKGERVPLDECHIEHIMPQKIEGDINGIAWQKALGIDWKQIHTKHVHTLGNLTLVSADYNKEMQNKPFQSKKVILITSRVYLNDYFKDPTLLDWSEEIIVKRGEQLAQLAAKVWPRPADEPAKLF